MISPILAVSRGAGGGAPPAANGSVHVPDDSSDEPGELTYVGIDTFEADF